MEQITPLLEKLANQLGTTIEHLWSVLLKQVNVEIVLCGLWQNIFLWGGIIIVAICVVWIIIMVMNEADEGYALVFVLLISVIIIAGCGYYSNYSDLITLKNNPEYWALKEILGAIK
jgi:dolichyl-phosphate-mannose--protein O-mannosyl transferase